MGMVVSCLSNIMYLSEKMVLWLTCVGLISCIMLMFIITLGMGIGLGYNYCFVDLRTKYKHVPGHYIYPGNPRWPYKKGARGDEPSDGPVMLPDTTENPLDEALRHGVSFTPEEPPNLTSNEDYFDKPMKTNSYNRKIINESDVKELVDKLGLNENNTTETDDADDNEEETTTTITTKNMETDLPMFTETVTEADTETVTEAVTETITETITEMTTFYTNSYPNFDDVDKGANLDAMNELVTGCTKPVIDPYTDDVTEAPVVDIDVDSPDQSGGKRVKKVVIPISGLDLISLLSKLKTENRNYSLQIVTT